MVMSGNSKIDVVNRPSIMVPPGYVREPEFVSVNQEPMAPPPIVEIPPTIEEEEMKSLFEKFEESRSDSVGWVQKDEVEVAKKRIKESLGFSPPPMAGYYMAVVVHEEKFARTSEGRKTFKNYYGNQ